MRKETTDNTPIDVIRETKAFEECLNWLKREGFILEETEGLKEHGLCPSIGIVFEVLRPVRAISLVNGQVAWIGTGTFMTVNQDINFLFIPRARLMWFTTGIEIDFFVGRKPKNGEQMIVAWKDNIRLVRRTSIKS